MVTYTIPFLVEHKRGDGPASISTVASLTTNMDGSLTNAELVLGAGDSAGGRRH